MARTKKNPEEVKKVEIERKTTARTDDDKKELIVRLNRIEGQIRGIKNMVERGDYCIDIIVQVMAATAALNGFNRELLAKHVQTCVVKDVQEGKMDKVDELAELFKRVIR